MLMAQALKESDRSLLARTYTINMACFKQKMPALYEYLSKYEPKKRLLGIDDYGQYNLFDGKKWVYPKGMGDQIQKQVDLYVKSPLRFVYKGMSVNENEEHVFFHTYFLEKISNLIQKVPEEKLDVRRSFSPMFIIIGVGIGLHLKMLEAKFNMKSLYIYEPDPDIFYASLFVTDYSKLIHDFTSQNRIINIHLGQGWGNFVNGISEKIKSGGYFYGAQVNLYTHYDSKATVEAKKNLHELVHRVYIGLGFYEDEVISINHSLLNMHEGRFQVIRNDAVETCLDPNTPVFIVGNGPSIDFSLDTIKKNQGKALIVSCSSSLGVLLKHGITPDFHVETERGCNVYRCLKLLDDVEKLKNIKLIALNTTYPKVMTLFKETIFAMKTNDVATSVLKSIYPDSFRVHTFCNPTSGNGAASIVANLGFKHIFLFGLDFGAIDDKQHHSKESFYFDDANPEIGKKYQDSLNLNLEVEGNLREKVKTSHQWDMANFSMESLIREYDLRCFNTSDGAKIECAQPLKIEDFPNLEENIDKSKCLNHIFTKQVFNITKETVFSYEETLKQEFLKIELVIGGVIETLKLTPCNKDDFFEILRVQKEMIFNADTTKMILYNLVWGTLSQTHLCMCSVLLRIEDDPELFKVYSRACFDDFKAYLLCCLELSRRYYKKSFDEFNLENFLNEVRNISGIKDVIG